MTEILESRGYDAWVCRCVCVCVCVCVCAGVCVCCTRRVSPCPMRAGSYVCALGVVCERVIACMCLRVCLRLPFDCHLNLWHVQQSYETADRQTGGRGEDRRGEREKKGGRRRRRGEKE